MDEFPPPPGPARASSLRFLAQWDLFKRLKGLTPMGPHRKLADELLGDIMRTCTLCEGTGTFGTSGGMGWMKCPACQGLGEVYAISDEELQRRRQKVLEAYPDAGIPDWEPFRQIRHPIWNRRLCVVVDGDTGERVAATELL